MNMSNCSNSKEKSFLSKFKRTEFEEVSDISPLDFQPISSKSVSGDALDATKVFGNLDDFLSPDDVEATLESWHPQTKAKLDDILVKAGWENLVLPDGKSINPQVLAELSRRVEMALDKRHVSGSTQLHETPPEDECTSSLSQACLDCDKERVIQLLDAGADVNEITPDGETPLTSAVTSQYTDIVHLLLSRGADPDLRDKKVECTALMEAASAGFSDLVRLLLSYRATVSIQSSLGNTALHYAASGGHLLCVQLVAEADAGGGCLEVQNENGHTALMEAASNGFVEVARMLVRYGACVNTQSTEFKETALTLACYKGHSEMVKFLLECGADHEHRTDEMHTALMEAAMDGHVEVAKLLLSHGAQVNMPTDSFESPLTLAACGGHTAFVCLLLGSGANVEEVNDEGYTPLMEAAREGHEEMVALLLAYGANINVQTDETQETALTLAACGGFCDVVDLLLRCGADLELGSSTPLMEAAQEGHLELVRRLITKGANVNAQTTTKDTALHYACENGHVEVCRLLLDSGADLDHVCEGGKTALMKASRAGNLDCVHLFVERGSQIDRSTSHGEHNALSLACLGGQVKVAEYLLRRNANPRVKLKDNSTMLIEAARGGHAEIMQLLFDYPASISAPPVGLPITSNLESSDIGSSPSYQLQPPSIPSSRPLLPPPPSSPPPPCCHAQPPASTLVHYPSNRPDSPMPAPSIPSGASPADLTVPSTDIRTHLDNYANLNESEPSRQLLEELFRYYCSEVGTSCETGEPTKAHHKIPNEYMDQLYRLLTLSKDVPHDVKAKLLDSLPQENLPPYSSHPALCLPDQKSSADSSSPPSPATRPTNLSSCCHNNGSNGTKTSARIARKLYDKQQSGGFIDFPSPSTPLEASCDSASVPSPILPTPLDSAFTSQPCSHCHHIPSPVTDAIASCLPSTPSYFSQSTSPVVDVNACLESTLESPLSLASLGGHTEAVKVLLDHGANIELRDKKSCTPLLTAVHAGQITVVKLLLDRGADIEAQMERNKETCLSVVAANGKLEIVEELLTRGANKEHRNISDYTPLSLAASGNYVQVIDLLLKKGAEINSRTGSKLGISPLMLASMYGHKAAVSLLLEKGSDINAQIETNKNTALTLACFRGWHEVVSLLLERKANIEHRAKTGLTPLMEAATGGHVEVARLLLREGADVNAPPVPSSRDTALTIAADKGHLEMVDLLLENSANVNAKNKKGATPLWLACNGGHLKVVLSLIMWKAGVNSSDNRKISCLMAACKKGHVDVVKCLVSHVTKFPSDSECDRVMESTKLDKDLSVRCSQCINIIKQRKKKQEFEANKNAQILLTQEREEEARKAKKREKKRQKRKAKQTSKPGEGDGDERDQSPETDVMQRSVEEIPDQEKWIDRSSRCTSEPPITCPTPLHNNNTLPPTVSSKAPPPSNTTTTSSSTSSKKKRGRTKEVTLPIITVLPSPAPSHSSIISTTPSSIPVNSKALSSIQEPCPAKSVPSNSTSSCKATSQIPVENIPPIINVHEQNTLDKKREKHRGKKHANRSNKKASVTKPQTVTNGDSETLDSSVDSGVPSVEMEAEVEAPLDSEKLGDWEAAFQEDLILDYSEWFELTGTPAGDSSEMDEWKTVPKRKVSIPVQKKDIGKVIGQLGATVKALRSLTGAHIDIEDLKEGTDAQERCVHIRGQPEAVAKAKEMIDELIAGKKTGKDVAAIASSPKRNMTVVTSSGSASVVSKGGQVTGGKMFPQQQNKPLPIRKTHATQSRPTVPPANTNNNMMNRITGQVPWVASSTKEEVNFASVAAAGVLPSNDAGGNDISTSSVDPMTPYESFPPISESVNIHRSHIQPSMSYQPSNDQMYQLHKQHCQPQISDAYADFIAQQASVASLTTPRSFARAPGSERHQRLTGTPDHSPQLPTTDWALQVGAPSSSTSPLSSDRASSADFLATNHHFSQPPPPGYTSTDNGVYPIEHQKLQPNRMYPATSDELLSHSESNMFHSGFAGQASKKLYPPSSHQFPRVVPALNPQAQSFSPSLGSASSLRCSTPPELRALPRVTADLNPSASTFEPQQPSTSSSMDTLLFQSGFGSGPSPQLQGKRIHPVMMPSAYGHKELTPVFLRGINDSGYSPDLSGRCPTSTSPASIGMKAIGSERRVLYPSGPPATVSPTPHPLPPSSSPFPYQDMVWNQGIPAPTTWGTHPPTSTNALPPFGIQRNWDGLQSNSTADWS